MPIENNAVLLARKAFAARFGSHPAPAQTTVQFRGADGIRQTPHLQSVALHSRASALGQSEPRAPANCTEELSRLRQKMNTASHYEPTGDERFD